MIKGSSPRQLQGADDISFRTGSMLRGRPLDGHQKMTVTPRVHDSVATQSQTRQE